MVISAKLTVIEVIILASLAASSKGLSRILVSPENTAVDAGDTLLLPCVVTTIVSSDDSAIPAATSLTWRRGGQVLQNSSRIIIHKTVFTYNSSSHGGRVVFIKSVLEVCGVVRGDEGEYSCSVTAPGSITGHGEDLDTATFQIHVLTASATVLVASTNEDLNASTTVFLSCVGFGLPVPELTWRRNQHKISTNTPHTEIRNDIILRGGQKFVRSTLILCNVTGELIGEYTCEAHNDMTSSEFTFMVTAPTPFTVKYSPPPTITLTHGGSGNFSCDFHGYPWPNIMWHRENAPHEITTLGRFSVYMFQTNSNGFLITRSVIEIHAAIEGIEGTYSCSAINEKNVHISESFVIDVIIPPQIVVAPNRLINMVAMPTTQQMLVVTCVALGSPRPTLQWRKNGETLKNSSPNGQFTIRETVKNHGGIELVHSQLELCGAERQMETEYSCAAITNTDASNSELFQICIIGEIEMIVVPSDQTITKGESIFLPCVMLSQHTDGSTTVTWKRERRVNGENVVEELKNTTKKVAIIQREEQRGSGGYILIRSTLHLGCVDEVDVGTYSCQVANAGATKTANFMIDIKASTPPPSGGPVDGGLSEDQINHAGYIGSLTTNILLLIVIAIHLVFRKLRTSKRGVPLINLCSSLVALNFSYIISFVLANHSGTGESGCSFLAALFHYLLLVGSFAFAIMVTFVLTERKKWSSKAKIIFYVITFVANWGLPAVIVSISAASNVSNYSSGLTIFCGPMNWSIYLGVAFPVMVVHLVTLIILILLPFLSEKIHSYVKQREILGVGITLILFDLIWGVGLSSFIVVPESSTQMTLQNVFITASAVHGLLIIFFFCVLSKKVREELIKLVSRRSKSERNSSSMHAEEGGLSGSNFTMLDLSVESDTPLHRRMSTGSQGCPASPGVDSVQSYPVNFRIATLEPIQEHQSDC